MTSRPLDRLAELIVGVGANVKRDGIVSVASDRGKEELTRAIARAAYRAGARFVDPSYFDPYVKRERVLHARDETLDFVPSWYGARLRELGRQRCARISLAGPPAVGALDDVDPARAARDRLPGLGEGIEGGDGRAASRAGRARPAAVARRGHGGDRRADDELDRRAVPDGRLGAARPPPARRGGGARPALAGGRARLPARRARSCRRVAGARGVARAGRGS